MDIRHEEFMAMADAFLGQGFDRAKLAKVERLQAELHTEQARLSAELAASQLKPERYVDEVNRLHSAIAKKCETILGPPGFLALFGLTAAQVLAHIDKQTFLEQLSPRQAAPETPADSPRILRA